MSDKALRIVKVNKYDYGYIEADIDYLGVGIVEDYIDLVYALEMSNIAPWEF